VQAFDTVRDSVASYMRNLNSHPRYKKLRNIRLQLRDQGKPLSALALADGLLFYSERRQEYIAEVRRMIRHNDLAQVDEGS
jgi:Bax protein